MLIRELQLHEISKLIPLLDQLGYPTTLESVQDRFRSLLSHPDYETLVVEQDERLIAFVGLHHGRYYEADGQYIRVVAFVVDTLYRRMGVGKELMAAVEQLAIAKGASSLVLNSGNREERQAAHHFYTQLGFTAKSTGFSKAL